MINSTRGSTEVIDIHYESKQRVCGSVGSSQNGGAITLNFRNGPVLGLTSPHERLVYAFYFLVRKSTE